MVRQKGLKVKQRREVWLRLASVGAVLVGLFAHTVYLVFHPQPLATPLERTRLHHALARLLRDPYLAGCRDDAALAKIPEPERRQWRKFWEDVAALQKKRRRGLPHLSMRSGSRLLLPLAGRWRTSSAPKGCAAQVNPVCPARKVR